MSGARYWERMVGDPHPKRSPDIPMLGSIGGVPIGKTRFAY